MARNVEIKAAVDDLAEVERRTVALGPRERFEFDQHDTFYCIADGRLKLRRFGDGTAELIFYRRPDAHGPKLSDFERVQCNDPDGLDALLRAAHGVRGDVVKHRTVYLVDRTRVHLDRVDGLGSFVELEVVLTDDERPEDGDAEARRLMSALGIGAERLERGAYIDLIEARRVAAPARPA